MMFQGLRRHYHEGSTQFSGHGFINTYRDQRRRWDHSVICSIVLVESNILCGADTAMQSECLPRYG